MALRQDSCERGLGAKVKKLITGLILFLAMTSSVVAQETQYQTKAAWDCRPDYTWTAAELTSPVLKLRFFVCLKYNHFLASSESTLKNESLYSKNT
jgi:hypothetical protein